MYIAAALLCISFFLKKANNTHAITKFVIIFIVALFISWNMHIISFAVSALIVLAGYEFDFRRIVKFAMWVLLCETFLVIASSLIGVAPDIIYAHGTLKAHSLGFAYYSNVPYHILMITIMGYWIIRSRIKENVFLLFSIPVQYIIYKIFTVRLVLYVYIIFLTAAILSRMINVNKEHGFIKFLATLMFPVAMTFTIIASFLSKKNPFFMALDAAVNWRFELAYRGFTEYGVKLFGQKIQTSQTYIDFYYRNHYFFIDSGYAYALLNYGLIFSILLIVGYSLLSRYSVNKNDIKLSVWCIVICVFSIINNIMFTLSDNPLPIFAMSIVFSGGRLKEKSAVRENKKINIM